MHALYCMANVTDLLKTSI